MPLINRDAVEVDDLAGLQLYALADLPEGRADPAGVILPPDVNLAQVEPAMARLAVIAIEFPKFRDGRGFTLARALRQQGYKGDLRAVGHFLPDQFLALLACGFSSFVTPPEHHPFQFSAMLARPNQPGQLLRRSVSRALEAI